MSFTSNEVFVDRRMDFDEVAFRYSPVLFRIALQRLRNVQDAEDAVQDGLLSAYKHIGQFAGHSQLSSWLARIVINAAGMKLRSRSCQDAVSLDQIPEDGGEALVNKLVDSGPTPEVIYAQTEMEEIFRRALSRVSPKLRVAFQMREIAGFSSREAAKALGITIGTLRSRVTRARAAIGLQLRNVEAKKLANEFEAPMMN